MTELKQINDFLAQKRLAIVGVSREPKDFTRAVFREFVKRNYDAVPVNLSASEIEGRTCFARVQDIVPKISAALVMTPAETAETSFAIALKRELVECGYIEPSAKVR